MSYRIRDGNKIKNNLLNSSISKQQYSIPKADRFHNNKTQISYKYYDLPSTNNRKAASFSCSQRKTQPHIDKNIPPPTKYFPNNQFKGSTDTNSIAFAKGRDECNNMSFIKISDNPGPGTYNPNPQFVDSHSAVKYSFRTKTQYSEKKLNNLVPGPIYQLKNAWLQKDKILSKDKNYGSPLIKMSKERNSFVPLTTSQFPIYYPQRTFKGEQTFNKLGYSIGRSNRFSYRLKTENNPGPGSYERFSEF